MSKKFKTKKIVQTVQSADNDKSAFIFEVLIIYAFSFLMFHYYQFQSNFIPGTDGYYHIKYAWFLRTEGFISNFKWASLSLWFENFSDKEFLYHVLLIPFTFFEDLQIGIKTATVCFAALTLTSFYAILRLNKINFSILWYLLLATSGGYFLYRANVPRPQVLSITLALWSIHFIINNHRKSLAALCVIYCYSYTAFMLPLIFSVIFSGYLWFWEGKLEWKTPAIALLAMLTGMVVHPYFPNNWTFFYLQNFYVLWMGTKGKVNMHMGSEFNAMNTRKIIEVNLSVIIPYFSTYFMALHGRVKTDEKTKGLFWISLSLIILTCFSKRFAEYAVPTTLIFCAHFFKPYLNDLDIAKLFKKFPLKTITYGLVGIVLMVWIAIRSKNDVLPQYRTKESGYKSAALYLSEHAPKGQTVYTCDWDDAPDLWFYNHNNNYLVFLDPNFMYYWNKRIWKIWDNLSYGRFGGKSYQVFKKHFPNITYGVCTSNFKKLKRTIRMDPRMNIVHETPKTYVFKID